VFRRIGKVRKSGQPRLGGRLSDKEYVADVLVARARRVLPDFEDMDLGGHSIRSGFITEGKKQGLGDSDLMAMSGHTDQRTFSGYYQVDAPVQESARVLAQLHKGHPRSAYTKAS
jgi:integrase